MTLSNTDALIETIQRLCEAKGVSVNKLATECGLRQSTIDSILKGKSKNPTLETVIKLADYFGVSLDYLVGRTDDPTPPKRSSSSPEQDP